MEKCAVEALAAGLTRVAEIKGLLKRMAAEKPEEKVKTVKNTENTRGASCYK